MQQASNNEQPKATILLVDDDKCTLELYGCILNTLRNHCVVIKVACPFDALSLLRDHQQIDVVVTDLNMPLMNGSELIWCVRKEYPHIRCALMSTDHYAVHHFAHVLNVPCIMKPTHIDTFLNCIDILITTNAMIETTTLTVRNTEHRRAYYEHNTNSVNCFPC